MNRLSSRTAIAVTALLTGLSGIAFATQDRYALKVPHGLAFSEFRGLSKARQPVAVSQVKDGIKLIAANTVMIDAFKNGLPKTGDKFPEGSKVVKIEWSQKQNTVSPYFVMVPDTLKSVSFIEKDPRFGSRRRTGGPTPSFSMIPPPAR